MGGHGRVKRQQVEADDGWTVITHGLSNLSVGNKKGKGRNQKHNAARAGSMPTIIVSGLTAEKLLQDFNNRTERWKDTACAHHLDSVLVKRVWNVNEAVCIGIGSFSRDWEHRHRAMWQLVLFMYTVSHLEKKRSPVKVYAQEPAFTPLDQEFLNRLNIEICETGIETHITPMSFVFSPFVDWYILLPLFVRDKDHVLYVGNEILDDYGAFAHSEEKRVKLVECNELGRKWLEKRNMVKMREFELHPHALNGMMIYYVQDGGEDGGKFNEESQNIDEMEDEKQTGKEDEGEDKGKEVGKEAKEYKEEETDTQEEAKQNQETND